ncbi:MAG: FAD-dependent oxidoreductase [Eubacteriales bacterium]|nr:FAD-dependent oxidoreductase [Eubacteriales bacterium]
MRQTDIAIVGSGPAGLTAAIYAAREQIDAILLDEYPGGQIAQADIVDNYPALAGISGDALGEAFRSHAVEMGAVCQETMVTAIEKNGSRFDICLHDDAAESHLQANCVIYAAGCQHRHLNIAGEERLTGHGVSYCASCDAAFYSGKVVAVVGGGDTALSEAWTLSRIAKTVYIIHRRDTFRAAAKLVNTVSRRENVRLMLDTVPVEIIGGQSVEAVQLRNQVSGEQQRLAVDGVFVAVGMLPDTKLVSRLADIDAHGYIIADETGVTSCPGLFAAGDVRTKQLRQVVTAAADGANCVWSAEQYLRNR